MNIANIERPSVLVVEDWWGVRMRNTIHPQWKVELGWSGLVGWANSPDSIKVVTPEVAQTAYRFLSKSAYWRQVDL
jgi:hypothetical protein